MTKKYDLIIVGAGPAGLMAARVAGENGLKTALLERKTDIVKIRRVDGGGLIPMNEYMGGEILTYCPESKRVGFPVSGISLKYDGPYQDMYGFRIYSPNGKCISFGNHEEMRKDPLKNRRGIALDKGLLLKGLLEEAEAAGVEIFPGTNVTGVEKKESSVIVKANEKDFEGTFVFAADGANSRIASRMGMNKERRYIGMLEDRVWHLEGINLPHIAGLSLIFTMYSDFFITTICHENQYHLGASTYDPSVNLEEKLHKIMYEDKVFSPWFKGAKKTGESSCVVNMYSCIREPFKDNVFFVGDSAWLLELTTPFAILCGWKAANVATLAILNKKTDKEGISEYLEWWQEKFYDPYGSLEFKPIHLSDFLAAEDIDYLAELKKEPFPPTLNFYEMLLTIGNTYGELFPRITEERPDVMEKLMDMVNNMEEVEEKARKAGFPRR
jgi:flavin-dependent dehydrogenase